MNSLSPSSPKVLGLDALVDAVARRQEAGERIVFTNGVFDLLHVGHVRYLAEARALGPDVLDDALKIYVPLKRAPSVDDLVNGVLFLASDLSRSITGQTLHIDGGTSASLGFLDWPVDSFMPAPLGGAMAKLKG